MYISISKNMQKKHNQIIKQNVFSYIFSKKKKKFFWFQKCKRRFKFAQAKRKSLVEMTVS